LLYRSLRSSTSNILNSFVNISAPFNPLLPTKILIHGFLDMPLSPAWQKMTSAILAHDDVNVVRVDWSSGNGFPYTQATSNTRVVGGQVALFILRLKNQLGMSPGQFHILGHSLGAHTAGYAGQRVEGLGRITGLDPAEPYFQYFHSSIRLDPSDADFVDVIHTDGGSILNLVVGGSGFGMSQACGHVDFFPNGGADQPGCFEADRKVNARHWKVAEDIACSHNRAVLYFIESLSSTDCEFVAHQCADYEAFEEGKCSSCTDEEVCGVMGIKAEELKGKEGLKMFLKTRGDPPFCLK
jgi:pancreatic triacylglycerol lipase